MIALRLLLMIALAAAATAANYWNESRLAIGDLDWVALAQGPLAKTITATGKVEALKSVEVNVEINERVEKLLVKEGADVQEGQVIAELTTTSVGWEFKQAKASLERARENVERSKKDLKVTRQLFRNHAISKQELENKEYEHKAKLSALRLEEEGFALKKSRLDMATVKAPMAGTILKIETKQGRRISQEKPLLVIGDISEFVVKIEIDEMDLKGIKKGQAVEIYLEAHPETPMRGEIATLGVRAKREGYARIPGTVKITDAVGLKLVHGLSVVAEIVTAEVPSAIAAPRKAIREAFGSSWVAIREGPWLKAKKIKTGFGSRLKVQILEGAAAGQEVGVPKAKKKQRRKTAPTKKKRKKRS